MIIVSPPCPHCGGKKEFEISEEHWLLLESRMHGSGVLIQDALPSLSKDERERFITGICPDCWNNMFRQFDEHEEVVS